ncbi:MAG: type I glyceraldehyde-3-phosphate dehydrogenase [Tenericutes bacterium]|jgi:glyceraldehyde 3-phosphate dehydrogenase|nr:type I glyceraldehyde-3-phosphate dehydrogenase [Bacilli bacterium]MDD3995103.1 type I glyceraldehyde-3-phosphate dehydrogenase [Bacilli bacterium]MDD4624648.1 type I glyceraldehyde-3-phosphate dehydrogenase [Bacilli bacterium]MDD4831306.1 type I glyceraldehyde-3-phosphate dehydrogenase [Bacilli bacterium]NLV90372.1 type I glyceraldehyde-3-phosphate dehydrogenase [Mycoplasmatota bacterium]
MAVKIAINGFGRIGRLAFRRMFEDSDFEIVAINDLTAAATLAHLLKYDTVQGRYKENSITSTDSSIIVDGKEIKVYSEKEPTNLPWGELGVDIVFECTGIFTSTEQCNYHIQAGAKRVILSAPGKDEDMKTVVYNVNHDILDGTEKVISAASCTTNCLAPMTKVMNDTFGIQYGMMTTIHAYTNDQNTLDAPHKKNLRRARAAAENIIPNSTGAAKAIGLVIPELNGLLDGGAQRVPVPTGSLTELTCILSREVTKDEINQTMKAASSETFGYTEDEIVSSDVIGTTVGSLFDATQTKVLKTPKGQMVKVVSWYDNEMGYTCQMIRLAKYINKFNN